jgi:hypothetical protein
MRHTHSIRRRCDACGRELESDQTRFCTDMCRVTFTQLFDRSFASADSAHADGEGGGREEVQEYSDDDDGDDEENDEFDLGESTVSWTTDDSFLLELNVLPVEADEEPAADDAISAEDRLDPTTQADSNEDDDDDLDDDDDEDDLDDLDDLDDEDDDLDDVDHGFDALDDDEGEDDELAAPARPQTPSTPAAVGLSAAEAHHSGRNDPATAKGPAESRPLSPSADGTIAWERVPEMENHVGVFIKRATCRIDKSSNGKFTIGLITELERKADVPLAGADTYLRLTAIAEDERGEFLAFGFRNIPEWKAFPPLYILGYFTLELSKPPARLRLYPEEN